MLTLCWKQFIKIGPMMKVLLRSCFRDEITSLERLSNLPEVAKPLSGKVRTEGFCDHELGLSATQHLQSRGWRSS